MNNKNPNPNFVPSASHPDSQYNILWLAFKMACDTIQKSGINITNDNLDMLEHLNNDTLKGYFLTKAGTQYEEIKGE